MSALDVVGLTVTFATDAGAVRAVDDVSFEVAPGEVLAVVGESGSGKSVTSRAAMGLLPPTATVQGRVTVAGRTVTRAMRGSEVAMVFQEPGSALDPLFTVGFQIAEAIRAHRTMTARRARARAIELLELVGIPDPGRRVDSYPHQLSGGQKQRVVIAMAIACEPAVIIADEPTTALDVTVQAEILALLRDLRERLGTAIVLITHNMGVVADMADRVVVMKDGRVVEEATVHDLFAHPQAEYTRELLGAVLQVSGQERTGSRSPTPAPRILDIVRLTVDFGRFRAVDGVSLDLGVGETVGLVGESGSGKSTVGRCVAGLQRPSGGQITVLGHDIVGIRERQLRAVRRRIGFVFQDPATSLNPRLTVGDCVAEPLIVHKVDGREERVRAMLDAVALPSGSDRRYPHELSGGQRQRVSLARALILRPELLIADEPTSALDVSVQARVLDLFENLQRELGFACLFISHDLAVVDRLCDRVAVLRRGVLVEQGITSQVLGSPHEDYTKRLVDAVPVPDPVIQRARHKQ